MDNATKLNNEELLVLYKNLVRVRKLDEFMCQALAKGKVLAFYHSAQGEEAVAVGACSFLRRDDYVALTHRGHGIGPVLAKGSSAKEFVAEHYGKVGGACRGISGWQFVDPDNGIPGYSSLLGCLFSVSVGWALAAKKKNEQQVVICFFGDGTSSVGQLHEAMNMASLWKLPIVYVCVNNGIAAFVPVEDAYPKENIASLGTAYDIPAVVVDGQDVVAVHAAVQSAVKNARAGKGPALVECKTARFRPHNEGNHDVSGYVERSKEQLENLRKRDPVVLFREQLLRSAVLTVDDVKRIDALVDADVKEAEKYAEDSPFPDPSVLEGILYCESGASSVPAGTKAA